MKKGAPRKCWWIHWASLFRRPISRDSNRYFSPKRYRTRKIAEADERVARVIKVRGAFASAFGPHSYGAPGARLIGLRYVTVDRKQNARLLCEAVVDLSDKKLVHFEDTREEE